MSLDERAAALLPDALGRRPVNRGRPPGHDLPGRLELPALAATALDQPDQAPDQEVHSYGLLSAGTR
jgi:hypothetical protein